MTDKDVTGQNIRSNLGFWGSNAGTAPLFLHLMFHTFHRTALSTFIDLFARGRKIAINIRQVRLPLLGVVLDSAVQQRKCNEIYWTLCCFFALQEVVSNALPTFPANDAAVEEWLIDIKQVYDRTAEQSGLGDILQDTKQQVAVTDAAKFSTRMTAARSRRGAPSVFQGHPHSTERVAQFERMQAEEASRARRGILTSTMPRPHNLQDTSTALYRRWFLNRAEGIEMQQSARCHNPDIYHHSWLQDLS
ncbi:hypothetical protein BJV82DRAFT_707654 [Fennellomyces sp. T-0311]|nr:hypothetical protein BJV82DRAFT_707654 [Fennellomyces sp. T-0311]